MGIRMNEQASRWWNVRQDASSRHAGETRKQLLLAAFEEIYRVGFQAASLQKILLRTGVTKGALYHHFPSKQALGHAVVDEIISVMLREQWIRPLETSTTPLLTMRQMILDAGSRMTGEDVRLGCPLNNLAQEMAPVDEGFRELTVGYVLAIVPGAPAIFAFLALRFTTEGIGRTRPIMYASIFSLVCNVFLNYVFMFGHFGAPALGAVGCGLASAITMWLIMFVLGGYMLFDKRYEPLKLFSRVAPLRPEALKEIIVLGVPIAITITAEAGLFNAVSILMGTRGAAMAAAHQVAINFAATMFMIPLALSSAITVRVSHALGAGNAQAARYSGALGILMCAMFMTCSATFLLIFRDAVVNLYTNDVSVTSIAIGLLLMAAVFQVADGVQIGAAGALRGYKDTRMPMGINIVAYWAFAFPMAYLAAVTYKLPPSYVWGGFVIGLSIAAVLLTWRYALVSRTALGSD